ncbi:MAG: D-alanine--D-alanine ligase [Bacteroidota bacterium]|nr:D-alanine--D-alanine ligase [Bacteroidota bacterium]
MENEQKVIGVLAGGYSSERDISLASGKTALKAFEEAGYQVLFVELDRKGFKVNGKLVKISDLGLSYVFNAVHGAPGEDGHISGMLKVMGIPHSTCDTFQSSLTFSKYQCNTLLKHYGIDVPKSLSFLSAPSAVIFKHWNFPLFIKPNRSGSSFGVSRIESIEQFSEAFRVAQQEGNEVIVEEGINGIEVGCGVLQSSFDFEDSKTLSSPKTQAIAITEIVPTDSSFFDYEAKYNGKSQEITPARIDTELSQKIEDVSIRVYDLLQLNGIVRMDFIINRHNKPVLIEVNSIPGLSPASIIPQQIKHRGWELSNVLSTLAEEHIT